MPRWTAQIALGVLLLIGSITAARAEGEMIDGFPNWEERVLHEWTNRARSDPQFEMAACGSNCADAACYTPLPPLRWTAALAHSARFHADHERLNNYLAYTSKCNLVANIATLYPSACTGAASCSCVGGTAVCSPTPTSCTTYQNRIALFGNTALGEVLAGGDMDPSSVFFIWLRQPFNQTTCAYTTGPPGNFNRWFILKSNGGGMGTGFTRGVVGYHVMDFGNAAGTAKIPSAAHYPRASSAVQVWANWYDTAPPLSARINVSGAWQNLSLARGTGTNGAWNASVTPNALTPCNCYYFSFEDSNSQVVEYPTTGALVIGDEGTCPSFVAGRNDAPCLFDRIFAHDFECGLEDCF